MPAIAVDTADVPLPLRMPDKLARPVPPFVTARVPDMVSVPVVVMGPPENVKPVAPPDTLTELTEPPDERDSSTPAL